MSEAWLAVLVAAGLGLRHALDPDHLVAVSGLGAGVDPKGRGRLLRVGFAWGAGHALTLTLAGLAVIVFGWQLTPALQQTWERVVGLAIVLVGIRIVMLYALPRNEEPIAGPQGVWSALGIGALHGLAGTGGVTLALLPIAPTGAQVPALLVFALMTLVSMTLCVLLASRILRLGGAGLAHWRPARIAVGLASIGFGAFYAMSA